MVTQLPHLTVEEVTAAAEVLEKLSRVYDYPSPELGEWCASDLRNEIRHIADYEQQRNIRNEIATAIVTMVGANGEYLRDVICAALEEYELIRNG